MDLSLRDLAAVCSAVGAVAAVVLPPLALLYRVLHSLQKRTRQLEHHSDYHQKAIMDSLAERQLLLKGMRACLDGLHQKGCNGQVTGMIAEMDEYLLERTHRCDGEL